MKYGIMLIAGMMLAASGVAQADNCDHPRNDFDGVYCLNKVYAQSDRDLGKAYRDLRHRLDASSRNKLKHTEIRWIRERDSKCSWHGPRGGFFVNLKCATDMTISRTNFLNDRIRECKATGCQPSKLK